jgi:hypothetical protein
VGHLLTKRLRAVVGKPYLGKPSAGQQSHKGLCVHLVDFYLGLSDGSRADGIRDDDATGMLLQESSDRVGIARRFQRNLIPRA